MFPSKISDLDHLRENKMIKFKREIVNGREFEIVSYMITDAHFWEISNALECRGHTYDILTGECVCAPFPKFFNAGEREDTQIEKIKNHYLECQEKKDGSMVLPVLVNGDVVFKTKKSFYSDVAILANKVCPDNIRAFSRRMLLADTTPIFEFNHPECQIVLDYGKEPIFTLLAMRNFKTGFFYSYDCMKYTIKSMDYDIPLVNRYLGKTWESILSDVENLTDFEGYVLLLDKGKRVKLKTKWYLALHRTMTELRVRDVAEMVVDETIDDCKSLLTSQGKDLAPVEEIERQVSEQIAEIEDRIEHLIAQYQGKDFKTIALDMKSKQEPLFGLIMYAVRGKEPDIVEYWKKNFLKNYSLGGVYNKNF